MPWLRHFALFVVFVTALFRPAAAGAFVSAPDANAQDRVGAFEFVAATLVGPASGATCGLHEGIGAAYDENASGYRFAAEGEATALRFGPTNPGPLPATVANTFRGGSYTATTLNEATTLYRVYGGTAGKLGSYWTRTAPSGPLQATIDLALNPQWGNTSAQVARIQVPAGTTIFEGAATAQGGLVGGGSQVFIPNVNPGWLF